MTSPGSPVNEYTDTVYFVVLAELRQAAEAASIAADPEGGAGTFIPGTPLRLANDPTNTTVAYWCRWAMKPSQRSALVSNIGGPLSVLPVGGTLRSNPNDKKWLFNGDWVAQDVLNALGFDVHASPDYGSN